MFMLREYAGIVFLLLLFAVPLAALLLLAWGGEYLLATGRLVRQALRRRRDARARAGEDPNATVDGPS
jgi:uncharacterized protein HemY